MSKLSYYFSMLAKVRPVPALPKLLNYARYRLAAPVPRVRPSLYTPQIAGLIVTKRCNLNCSYCNAAKMLHEGRSEWRRDEADLEKIRRIFAHGLFRNCLLVDLLGGEPLLVGDLARIVAYFTEHGHLTNTSTNGLLLGERIVELKRAGISRINVSVYDANRSVLERDLGRINRIFPVHASVVLLKSHLEGQAEKLAETARFIRDCGCRSLRFWMYRPMGTNPDLGEVVTAADPAYLEFRRRIESLMPGFCLWPAAVDTAAAERRCRQLWQRLSCDMSGNVFPCCGIDAPLSAPPCNVFQDSAEAIFNHPTLVRMRTQLLACTEPVPDACRQCNLLGEPGW